MDIAGDALSGSGGQQMKLRPRKSVLTDISNKLSLSVSQITDATKKAVGKKRKLSVRLKTKIIYFRVNKLFHHRVLMLMRILHPKSFESLVNHYKPKIQLRFLLFRRSKQMLKYPLMHPVICR